MRGLRATSVAAEVSFYSGATIFESLALGDVVSVCFCTSLPLGSQSSGIERKLNATIQSQGLCIPVRLHFLVFRSNVAKHIQRRLALWRSTLRSSKWLVRPWRPWMQTAKYVKQEASMRESARWRSALPPLRTRSQASCELMRGPGRE